MSDWLPVRERPPRRRLPDAVLYGPLLGGAAALLAVAGLVGKDSAEAGLMLGLAGAVGLVVYRLIVHQDQRFANLAIRADEAPMLRELDVPHGVLVAVWVMQGQAVTGADRGAMWVEDGRLTFCGRRTSFVLTRDETEGLVPGEGPGTMRLRLRERTPAGPLGVAFTPLYGDRPYRTPLEKTVAEWLDHAPALTGLAQLPPRAVGPGALPPAELRRRLGRRFAIEAGFVGLLALPFAVVFGGFVVSALALFVALFLAFVPAPELAAFRDWRRLEEDA